MVGSIVGYTTATMFVQAGVLGVGPNNIVEVSKKRRQYIEGECLKSIEIMTYYKNQFDAISKYFDDEYNNVLIPHLLSIEESLLSWSPNSIITNLALFNENFSKKIKFRNFEEFEHFMKDSKSTLTL